jgi:hypothetical protein
MVDLLILLCNPNPFNHERHEKHEKALIMFVSFVFFVVHIFSEENSDSLCVTLW